jgi:tetratricopeptide (TPR) repeat protein
MPAPAARTLPEFVRAPSRPSAHGNRAPSRREPPRQVPASSASGTSGVRAATLPEPVKAPAARPEPAAVRRARQPSMIASPEKRGASAPAVVKPTQAARKPAAAAAPAASGDANDLARRARRALEGQHYDEAFQLLMRAQRLAPHDTTCKALRGYLMHLRGNRTDAPERLLDEALAQDPLCERAHHYKGLLALARHDVAQAAFHFSEAVVIDPENTQAAHLYRRCRDEQRGVRGVLNAVLLAGERWRAPFSKDSSKP